MKNGHHMKGALNFSAVIEVTSYELTSVRLLDFLKIPDGYKAVALPLCTPDGLPNHVQILLKK